MKNRLIPTLFCLIGTALLLACGDAPLVGTVSEENTGTVSGIIRYEDNQPAGNIPVTINNIIDSKARYQSVVYTDSVGQFFKTDLDFGHYSIEVIRTYTGAMRMISLHPPDSIIDVEMLLKELGAIQGSIDTGVSGTAEPLTVYIPEINRTSVVSLNGEFTIKNLAASSYSIAVVKENDTVWNSLASEIRVIAGKNTIFDIPGTPVIPSETTADSSFLLTCSALSPTSATLRWNIDSEVTNIRVFRSSGNMPVDTIRVNDHDTIFIASSLEPQTTYRFGIIMKDRFTDYRYRSPQLTVITPAADTANRAPVIALWSPAHDTAVVRGSIMTITANASDCDGSIDRVLFSVDDTILHSANKAPYKFDLYCSEMKKYTLTAGAIDDNNDTTWSTTISVYVDTLLRGDVNNDGYISVMDAEYVSLYQLGLPVSSFNTAAADVNGDSIIDIVDALIIAQLSNGIISLVPWYTAQ